MAGQLSPLHSPVSGWACPPLPRTALPVSPSSQTSPVSSWIRKNSAREPFHFTAATPWPSGQPTRTMGLRARRSWITVLDELDAHRTADRQSGTRFAAQCTTEPESGNMGTSIDYDRSNSANSDKQYWTTSDSPGPSGWGTRTNDLGRDSWPTFQNCTMRY